MQDDDEADDSSTVQSFLACFTSAEVPALAFSWCHYYSIPSLRAVPPAPPQVIHNFRKELSNIVIILPKLGHAWKLEAY